jgi:glycosyltransferase involved in cell wall biosynthesis
LQKINLVLAIRSLDIGGAERQFIELVKHIDKKKFNVLVVTMYGGVWENEIEKLKEVKYVNLKKKGRYDLNFYFKYKKLLNDFKPDIIYSWLGEMNLFSYWCMPKEAKLIWGFRASNMDYSKYGKFSQFLFYLQKIYSKKVDKIVTNSVASLDFHKKNGFFMDKAVVVYNGIDIKKFKRDEQKKKNLKKKYNLSKKDITIGIVARIDYMKGYPILAKTAKKIFEEVDNIKLFVIGDGNKKIKKECEDILGEYNNKKFIWLGKRKNVKNFYNLFDIYVSSSLFGEGFSNSIAEAMACGVPCVVTDVGDSKTIVGDCGEVVKPNSWECLKKGIENILKKDLKKLGECSRKRVVENFSIEKMVKKTEEEICAVL